MQADIGQPANPSAARGVTMLKETYATTLNSFQFPKKVMAGGGPKGEETW